MKKRLPAKPVLLSVLLFGMTIGCAKPDDTQIAAEVRTRINADSNLRDKQITVTATDGEVTVGGTVDSSSESSAAASYASSVKGVKRVVNEIRVARK